LLKITVIYANSPLKTNSFYNYLGSNHLAWAAPRGKEVNDHLKVEKKKKEFYLKVKKIEFYLKINAQILFAKKLKIKNKRKKVLLH
jgi:hypothetical protein